MQLIDGNAIASAITTELRESISLLPHTPPKVAFVRVGEDPASVSYVRKKEKTAAAIGAEAGLHVLPDSISQNELFARIDQLNADPAVHGILVQAPLPTHINDQEVFNQVDPRKDVDGFNRVNIGKLAQEDPSGFVACTPLGIIEILLRSGIETTGKHAVIVGRSLIVGKPLNLLLMRKAPGGNATVTVCHSRSHDLGTITRQADILIAAIGSPEFIRADMVREGAVVIDVGINRITDLSRKSGYRLVGDVAFDEVAPKTAAITPVPGGVGPMTVAMLMQNTLKARNEATR